MKLLSLKAATATFALLLISGHALAAESSNARGSAAGSAVDAWSIVGDTINATMGPRSCTVSASTPVASANVVNGAGSVSCSRAYAKLTLTICIQAKQAFVSGDSATWDENCGPTKARLNGSSLSASHSRACLPGPWRYRTKTIAEGFNAGSSDPVFQAWIISGGALYDCFI